MLPYGSAFEGEASVQICDFSTLKPLLLNVLSLISIGYESNGCVGADKKGRVQKLWQPLYRSLIVE